MRSIAIDVSSRPLRNVLLRALSLVPAFRRRLALQLSGLVYRPEPRLTPSNALP